MTETGAPRFPSPSLPETQRSSGRSSGRSDGPKDRVQIVRLPENLREVRQQERVRGEVTHADKEGRVRVSTDRGDIEVQVDPRVQTFQKGDSVEIRIPPGNPPVQATLRPAPVEQVNVSVEPVQHVDIPLPSLPLETGQTFTLKPLAPQDAARAVRPYFETLVENLPAQSFIQNLNFISQDILETVKNNILIQASEIGLPPPSLTAGDNAFLTVPALPVSQDAEKSSLLHSVLQQSTLLHLPEIGPEIGSEIRHGSLILSSQDDKALSFQFKPLQVRLEGMSLPASLPAPETPQPPAPENKILEGRADDSIRAEVRGFTPERHFPVLTILTPESRAGQNFVLERPGLEIAVGTTLSLRSVQDLSAPIAPPQASAPAPLAMPLPLYFTTPGTWPLLEEVQQALVQAAPTGAVQIMGNIVPSPSNPAQFGPAALFFLSAVRAGDLQGWMGEKALDALRRGDQKFSLLSRLSQEFSALGRFIDAHAGREWRAMALPLAWQNEIHKMALYYRREDERGGTDKDRPKGGNTRFILNLSLSRIGPAQIDALYQPGAARLDLILRTEQTFSKAMQGEMRGLYKSAVEDVGITGELGFQDKAGSWVTIQPHMETFGASA
ncbi:MAG: hypothetical protein KDI13_04275 [Alphaproteobacteria bacterium]|nr:hypothetical protein [Alphaproteobacteria bacterium]